jgi:DNA-binding transcriptional LysR family regulator
MDLDELRTFLQVARDGSFSKAARSLAISQPAISARIAALEQELGGRLFTRGGRSLAPTELGQSFLPYVDRMLATLHEGVETARQVGAGQRGRTAVGTIQPLCGDFLDRAVARFQAGHPQVDLFVRVGHSEQVIEMLYDRVVQIGVIGGWPSDWYNPAIAVLERIRQPLALIVPAGSPLAGRDVVRLRHVAEAAAPLYLVAWTAALRPLVSQALASRQAIIEIPFEMAHRSLLGGRGAVFATRSMVASDLLAGRLHAVSLSDVPPLYYENAIVSLRGATLPRPVAAFLELLRMEAQVLPDAS